MPKRKQTLKEKLEARKEQEKIVGISRGVRKKKAKKWPAKTYDFPAKRKPLGDKKDERKWDKIEETYPYAPAGLRRRVYNNYYDRRYKKKK